MRLALFGYLRFCVQEKQFESIWLPPAVRDKDLITTKTSICCTLTSSHIIRLLDSILADEISTKWKFALKCMAVYGLSNADLRTNKTSNGDQEIWTKYVKSRIGKKVERMESRRLYPFWYMTLILLLTGI